MIFFVKDKSYIFGVIVAHSIVRSIDCNLIKHFQECRVYFILW